ncbi:MAG: GAF domain-containing sensor histidine kinase [Armatimonadota bacterium]
MLFGLFVAAADHYLWVLFPTIPYSTGHFFLALLLGICFLPLLAGMRLVVAKALKRGPDIKQVVQDLSRVLAQNRDQQIVAQALTSAISRVLHPRRIAMYLPASPLRLYKHPASSEWDGLPEELPEQELVLRFAKESHELALTDELLEHPAPLQTIGQRLRAWEVEVILPLLIEDSVHGVILLGEHQSGNAYTVDDLDFLRLIAYQAATSLDNAYHYEELSRLNEQLEAEVAERTRELEEAMEKLRGVDEAKDRFLAVLSHELLTPITSVIGWVQLARKQQDPELLASALEVIERNGHRQRHLLGDLLDVSKVVHGKFEVKREPCELWQIIQQCVENMALEVEKHDCACVLMPPADSLPVLADQQRVQQVISNLMTNALKFTPSGGTITVCGSILDEHAVISVSDTGQGIPCDELPYVFEFFQQGTAETSSSHGLGLGLALVRGIVEAHEGRVTATSAGEGKGSTFTFALPLAAVTAGIPVEV